MKKRFLDFISISQTFNFLIQKIRRTKFRKNIDDEIVEKVQSDIFSYAHNIDKDFYKSILKTLQNWYALYGWPGGIFSFEIPTDIRT